MYFATSTMSSAPRSVGIIGYGHFGQFIETLVQRFIPSVSVRVYSRRMEQDGEQFYTLAATATSDVVVFCGGINEYETQLQAVLEHVRPETILVDVATVKCHTEALFEKYASGQRYVCCHPMFGPESYKKSDGDVTGFRIVVTDTTLTSTSPRSDLGLVKEWLQGLGFLVIEMTADAHDKKLAGTLFLTHYIAQTMKEGGFGRTDLDTVSFGSLMNAVESVQNDRKLFEDVYRFNPYCKEVAECFHAAQNAVYDSLLKD